MTITFQCKSIDFSLREEDKIVNWIANTINKESKFSSISLRYIFCDDEELLAINRTFLQHDYYTDIITFPLSEPGSLDLEAELYISIDRVRENAVVENNTFRFELCRVIIHGVLHLCGFGDKTKEEIYLMREKESQYLSLL